MAAFVKPVFTGVLAICATLFVLINSYFEPPPVPKLDNTYWGPGISKDDDVKIHPFKIAVDTKIIDDLKWKLSNTKLTPALEGVQQQYGFNAETLKPILDYWSKEYEWPKRQEYLNQFPQFKTKIQGLDIHFIHVKPTPEKGVTVLPILLLHGWPGSVVEFYKVIPLLTHKQQNRDVVFEVIVPSIPGFGFSDGASKMGLGPAKIGIIMKNLMKRLNFDKFYIQGGDLGAFIARDLAVLHPEVLLGLHTNLGTSHLKKSTLKYLLGSIYPGLVVGKEFEDRMYPISKIFSNIILESGYFHIQATKPDTIGVALRDSPAGLAAYILEKFSTGTNRTYKERLDAGLLEQYSYDELIDNLMLYWVTGSMTTACRIYAEFVSEMKSDLKLSQIPIDTSVPCAVARFPYEISYQPDWILKDKYQNLVQTTDFKEGGHFAAFEVPRLLAEDIYSAVEKMRLKSNK